ncbi:hypothetical protein ABK040_012851 [Willaertia magna]
MEFVEYQSIDNFYKSYKTFLIDPNYDKIKEIPWVVTEKVHGSNFSFIVSKNNGDTEELKVCKRGSILTLGDLSYYPKAVEIVKPKYEEKCLKLFKIIENYFEDKYIIKSIQIYGELFGGHYPHPEVENVLGRVPIQRHVYYSIDYDFYVFDIRVTGMTASEFKQEVKFFIGYDEMIKFLMESGFEIFAKELFRGTLEECLNNFNSVFNSIIPKEFYNLPEMEENKNICEGIVIKPIKDTYTKYKRERMIIKKKNDQFNEKIKNPNRIFDKKIKEEEEEDEKIVFIGKETSENIYKKLLGYLNENRLEGNVSKIGDIYSFVQLREQCIGLFAKDALDDFIKENKEEWDKIVKEDQKKMKKKISEKSRKMVIAYIRTQRGL